MTEFDQELHRGLAALREQGLYRELRRVDSAQGPRIEMGGRFLLNFSSNDYLGLANAPALKEAAAQAVERYGAGAGASRLMCGSLAPYHELEETIAAFKATEAALSFSSGYATALGALGALLDRDAIVVLDKLVHACIVDAARQSGARMRVFTHNDLNDLEDILKWAAQAPRLKGQRHVGGAKPRVLVVTESLFSMDGDQAPLTERVELKDRYGAWLMVDEAHATGLYGSHRRGLAEAMGVAHRIEVQMGTLGKALGAAGGYIAGSRVLIDYLINRARSFIFSTAPVPAAAGAAAAAIRLVQSSEGGKRRDQLWERLGQLSIKGVAACARPGETSPEVSRALPNTATVPAAEARPLSPIIPLLIGDETAAVNLAASLRGQGIFIPAVRYPTVARGAARLRLTLTAAHAPADLEQLHAAWERALPAPTPPSAH